jgi:hypothetical protein
MERVEVMLDPLRAFLYQAGAFLPRIGIAVLVLIAGYLVAAASRYAVEKGLRAINLHIVTRRSGLDEFMQSRGTQTDTVTVLGVLLYWVVIVAALIIAFNTLGLTYVTEMLGRVMLFIPRLAMGLLILAFGTYFARFMGNSIAAYCARIHVRDGETLGRFARYAIVALVVVIAFDQLDIGGNLLRTAFLILLSGVVFALALAFGLGGKEWAAERLHEWWPSDSSASTPRKP